MRNLFRKLFRKNRPLTTDFGPRKKFASSIERDSKGRWGYTELAVLPKNVCGDSCQCGKDSL